MVICAKMRTSFLIGGHQAGVFLGNVRHEPCSWHASRAGSARSSVLHRHATQQPPTRGVERAPTWGARVCTERKGEWSVDVCPLLRTKSLADSLGEGADTKAAKPENTGSLCQVADRFCAKLRTFAPSCGQARLV